MGGESTQTALKPVFRIRFIDSGLFYRGGVASHRSLKRSSPSDIEILGV